MSFGEHLEDLRRRLILSLVGLIPLFLLGMYFGKTLLEVLMRPALAAMKRAGQPPAMQVTSFLEAFGAYFKLALVLTIVLGAPWMIYQLWLFVSPGLRSAERRFAYLLAPLSLVLSVLGVAFLYFAMLPLMLYFLVGFSASIAPTQVPTADLPPGVVLPQAPVLAADPPAPGIGEYWINSDLREWRACIGIVDGKPKIVSVPLSTSATMVQQYKVSEYMSLMYGMLLAFALGFQAPVVVLLLGWVGLVDAALLRKYRKHAIFVCAFLAAVLTPTGDPISLAAMTVPLVILYELGIILLRFVPADRVARGWGARPRATWAGEGDAGGP